MARSDALLVVASSSALANLETDKPIIYTSDATARLMRGYYPDFTDLDKGVFDTADEIEARAISKASALIYPSSWAAESAIRDYDADPGKVFVHPYGANIEQAPPRSEATVSRRNDTLQLVFIGVNWERKGGPLALECLATLKDLGIRAHLTIIGTVPPNNTADKNLTVYPFLDKSDPADATIFKNVMSAADFLLVPTRAECQGIVWCEAAAYGVPSIATDTGGVSGAVREGKTGFLLPLEAPGSDYAELIRSVLAKPGRLDELRESARSDYDERLNWTVWSKTFRRAFEFVLS